jgi:hypothetical protein
MTEHERELEDEVARLRRMLLLLGFCPNCGDELIDDDPSMECCEGVFAEAKAAREAMGCQS